MTYDPRAELIAQLTAFRDEIRNEYDEDVRSRVVFFIAEHAAELIAELTRPIPIVLCCPSCNQQHIDEGEFATRPHHTHQCVRGPYGKGCGCTWRPSKIATVGVYGTTIVREGRSNDF